ncbi:signal peptide peptidase-like 2B [Uloborus diversus]|uniref:signal peptide peptidase-like 2B n=1 Tax=Uloborus diversus TaxID=327109 RepID=UPI002409249C|nr:signal peptide peptidase-like 2B [Uloborus diversus]
MCGRNMLLICLLLFLKSVESATNEYGVLAAESSSEKENFCIIYFKEFAPLPQEKSEAKFHFWEDTSNVDWCEDHPEIDSKSKILLLNKNNCSISDQARNVQDRGGEGILFITERGRVGHYQTNDTAAQMINISVGLISENSVDRLKKMDNTVTVRLFAPLSMNFDFSLLVIWVIALITVTIGAYWSGHIRFAIYCKEMSLLPGGADRELPNKPCVKANTAEDSVINVSPYYVGAFVLCMGTMLVLLYFFFDYLVYFIIGLFVLASVLSVHSCLEPLFLKIPATICRPTDFRIRSSTYHIDFRQILLICLSIAISVYWLLIRKDRGAWILQDILGVAFCIHMLKNIRLPSLKICTVLLVLLFFYDIFFVFVTPFMTVRGESVMEEVATGGKSQESLPMVLRVAHFGFDPLAICYQQFSMLGFGDILVPGLLISYCHGFDLITNKKSLYFPITVAAYGIGLLITFVGLFLMNTAQPALLYLVPSTLLPPFILGWCRKELSLLWSGFKVVRPRSRHPTVQVASNASQAAVPEQVVPSSENTFLDKDGINPAGTTSEIAGDRNYLLR